MKFERPESGQWVQPIRKGYKLACCDCGSVHRMDFKLVDRGGRKFIQFRAFRDNRSTAVMRRHDKKLKAKTEKANG